MRQFCRPGGAGGGWLGRRLPLPGSSRGPAPCVLRTRLVSTVCPAHCASCTPNQTCCNTSAPCVLHTSPGQHCVSCTHTAHATRPHRVSCTLVRSASCFLHTSPGQHRVSCTHTAPATCQHSVSCTLVRSSSCVLHSRALAITVIECASDVMPWMGT